MRPDPRTVALASAWVLALAGALAPAATTPPSRDPVMRPPATEAPPPMLDRVQRELRRIAATRDADALLAHVREETKWSFGGDHGRAGFQTMWRDGEGLDRFWVEFDRVLALPGRWHAEEGGLHYCTPYVFCDALPDGVDPFATVVVLGRGVALRAGPAPDARVLARVDHAVLASLEDDPTGGDWVRVRLASGTEGYIARRWVRRPIDFRLGVTIGGDGQWWLDHFVAGD